MELANGRRRYCLVTGRFPGALPPLLWLLLAGAAQTLLATIVVWAPFLLIEVVAHEMGHVLAGRLVGFRFVFCTIGPLKLTARGRGLALGYSENWVKVAGSAASVPTHPH